MPVINVMLCLLFLALNGEVLAASVFTKSTVPKSATLSFQSADTCRTCHTKIFEEWSKSWMANAFTNKVFQADLSRFMALDKNTEQSSATCLRCHAPAAILTSDEDAREGLSREGVTCEVCHRVAMVRERSGKHHLVMDPRNIQYGRNKNVKTSSHTVRFSEALDDSSLCAGCHLDMQGPEVPLERTYREWANSTYREQGIHCRTCHMPEVPGPAAKVPGKAVRDNATNTHASHRFHGGHSDSPLLQGAASLHLKYNANEQQLLVQVSNLSVGHNFPTGGAHPAELVLEVTFLNSQGEIAHQIRELYKLSILDKEGASLTVGDRPANSVQDTTLKPMETRDVVFKLSTLPEFQVVDAALVYYLLPADAAKLFDQSLVKNYYQPVEIARCRLIVEKDDPRASCK